MLFSRHIYWTTLGHILFILATAGTGLWLIISQQGVVIGILLVICSLFQIGRLVNKLNSFNQKLRLFFDAIEDKDNMLYFPENNVSREQEMMNRTLNRINALLIRTQAEYSKQEHFYRSLLEEVPSGVLAWDSSGKIMMANSAALTLLGCQQLAQYDQLKPILQEKEKKETVHREAEVPFWTAIRSLFTNKYWILCLVMCLGFYFLMSYASSATVYFAQYVMEDISLQGTLASVLYIVLLVGIILALPVMTKIGKRNTMAIGLAISAVGWFLPQITLEKTIVIAASAIVGIGFGFIAAPAGSFLQDTLTYGTWKSGVTAIGMGNAAFSFVNKLSSALGTIILGFVLDAGKFVASLAVQPTSAIHAIKLLYIWMPTVICLVCLGLSVLYDLDKKLPFIEEEIKAGRIGEKRKMN